MSLPLETDKNLESGTHRVTTLTMLSNILVVLLASVVATPVVAIPHEVSKYQTVHGSSTVSELTKRETILLSLWNDS
jgi:hypothetical protein